MMYCPARRRGTFQKLIFFALEGGINNFRCASTYMYMYTNMLGNVNTSTIPIHTCKHSLDNYLMYPPQEPGNEASVDAAFVHRLVLYNHLRSFLPCAEFSVQVGAVSSPDLAASTGSLTVLWTAFRASLRNVRGSNLIGK